MLIDCYHLHGSSEDFKGGLNFAYNKIWSTFESLGETSEELCKRKIDQVSEISMKLNEKYFYILFKNCIIPSSSTERNHWTRYDREIPLF